MTSCRTVRALPLALVGAVLAGALGVHSVWAQALAAPDASGFEKLRAETQRIARLFYGGQHEAVMQ